MTVAVSAGVPAIAAAAKAAIPSPASAGAAIKTLTGWTFFARTRLVDGQGPALKVLFVQRGDGFLRVGRVRHFDEGEAPGTTGCSILHDVH